MCQEKKMEVNSPALKIVHQYEDTKTTKKKTIKKDLVQRIEIIQTV